MSALAQAPIYYWALPFLAAAGLTVAIEKLCIRWAVLDHPGERKMQKVPVPRMGGLAFVLVPVLFCAFCSVVAPWELIAGSLIVFLGGLYDDFRPANSVASKLIFQIPGALLFACATDLSYVAATLPQQMLARVAIFLLVFFLINAANLMDNMNGLTAGLALIIMSGLVLLAATFSFNLAAVGTVVTLSVAGFLMRNYPFGKIYMGDQGSQLLGFFVPAYAILVIPKLAGGNFINVFGKTSIVALVLFSLFIVDVITVVRIRTREKRSIFQGDQCHISHQLVKRGLTPVKAVLLLAGLQLVLTVAALSVFGFGRLGASL